jgi:Glycosyl transferases group 1
MYEKLAAAYARSLDFTVLHLVIQQNLLPFLWRDGHLGGRTFDVLMTAMPMNELQRSLDLAHELHPESTTLSDFRADPDLIDAETGGLAAARRLITPHTGIASLFGPRSDLLEWTSPPATTLTRGPGSAPCIVFPASTVGRKGCYELREAIRGLDVSLVLLGPSIEGKDFWQGFNVCEGTPDWMQTADVVVLPAFVEHRPRRLISAAAAGIPVIASRSCGVDNVPGVTSVEAGDAASLRNSIVEAIANIG